jgi:DNA-directed RNA polymerase subunit RPC12/RpoP
MSIVKEIKCSNCGAPIEFKPGEIIATCKYCGYTVVIETGKAFVFEHSMLLNKYTPEQAEDTIRNWMSSGFLKPRDFAKSKILEKNLVYLPFWIITINVITQYKGIFERISPPIVKEGKIEKHYSWLILARKATEFPTREYDVPLKGKIPYDFRKIEKFAKVLNSEMDRVEAVTKAKQEIEEFHKFLIKQDIDRIIEARTEFQIEDAVYLHAPIWFMEYEYKNERYRVIMDGATGAIIKGDIPPPSFGLF